MDVDASLALVEAAAASFAASVRVGKLRQPDGAQRQRLDDAKRKTQGSDVPATPQTTMSESLPRPQTPTAAMAPWQQQASANKSHRHLSRSLELPVQITARRRPRGREKLPRGTLALKALDRHHTTSRWCCKKKKRRRVKVQPTSIMHGENASQAILEMTAKQEVQYQAKVGV